MKFRVRTVAAWLVVAILGASGVGAADPSPTSPLSNPDTSAAPPTSPVARARLAWQNAYLHRQAGDFGAAAAVADSGLREVAAALESNPDQTTRMDLTDLQSRLTALRQAAQHDGDAAADARKSGNEADDRVLNAPATDGIEPDLGNQAVLDWVRFFTTNGRSTFERWLKRSGRYMELFRQALQKEGLPPDLVHLVFVESGFNLNARSVSSAVGPWQFVRSTARLFGLNVNKWVDERKDPEKSTVAAARYLKHLYSIFGDWPLAIASYNAGEGTILRAIQRQGTTNYWDLKLPRQTEDYVPQFMAVLEIVRNPEKYGFDEVELDDPMAFDQVALKGPVDLRALARLSDCTYEELKSLNPAVLRQAATGGSGVTTVRVPAGQGPIILDRLQHGARLPVVDLTLRHRVRRGETLQAIANDYHVSARRLALLNGIGRKHPLRRGTVLTVPASLDAPSLAVLDADDPRAATDYVPPRDLEPRVRVQGQSTSQGRLTHTVRRGETLASVAKKYGVEIADIRRWNHLRSDRIRRGTRLKIRLAQAGESEAHASDDARAPASGATPLASGAGGASSTGDPVLDRPALDPSPAAKSQAPAGLQASQAAAPKPHHVTIVVHRGETLSAIAERHGVSVQMLMKANGLTSTRVRAGQRLKLPTS